MYEAVLFGRITIKLQRTGNVMYKLFYSVILFALILLKLYHVSKTEYAWGKALA